MDRKELQKLLADKITEGLKGQYWKCPKCNSLIRINYKVCPICQDRANKKVK